MFERCVAICRSSIAATSFAAASFAAVGLPVTPAAAWHHHSRHHWPMAYHSARHHARPGARSGDIAAIVVDANSNRVLYARNENDIRHPASITKVMTLYLLFEQLEKGRMRLDTRIAISAHAAQQAPTKLGLDEGDTISVDDAIKAVVTKSANDIAVAIAEAIGGDEQNFAALMTRKARALGMTNTVYVNASGLPSDEQVTTARDLAILGRAVQERFPRYYHYFSTPVFYFDGVANRNHNHLLGRIDGMDGIKTGYTNASGFNLLTSVKRDGHYIVAVVLGGQSAASRDRIMADLVESEIDKGATRRTAPLVAENTANERNSVQTETADARELHPAKTAVEPKPEQKLDAKLEAKPVPEPRPAARLQPAAAELVPPDPVQVATIGDQMPPPRPRPAFVAATPKLYEDQQIDRRRVVLDGSTVHQTMQGTTPTTMRWIVGPASVKTAKTEAAKTEAVKTEPAKAEPVKVAKAEPQRPETVVAADMGRPAAAKSGWMIQIGATDDIAKANDLLARAKTEGRGKLNAAQAFTEKVQKGAETLYRARFAGLAEDQAESACRTLKQSGFACFATKN